MDIILPMLVAAICIAVSAVVARMKHRSVIGWGAAGIFMVPLLVLLFLPDKAERERKQAAREAAAIDSVDVTIR